MNFAAQLFNDVFEDSIVQPAVEAILLLSNLVVPPITMGACVMGLSHAHAWTDISKWTALGFANLAFLSELAAFGCKSRHVCRQCAACFVCSASDMA